MSQKIAIFASGNGSNAQRIAEYFSNDIHIEVRLILCNNEKAYVIERAKQMNVPCIVFSKAQLNDECFMNDVLIQFNIDWIVLAGFLLKVPAYLIRQYNKRIINIHPALLPDFGGKGMYGDNVHKQVIASGVKESGISIHYVNEFYDEGEIIFQVKTILQEGETPDSLAQKIHKLEHEYYPKIIRSIIK